MKILLTGSNGFLGKTIIKTLESEYQILTLSRNSGEYRVCLDKEVPAFKESYDLVIHAAGKVHSVPKTDTERKKFYDVNLIGTENLLKGLEKTGMPKRFVFISSVSVYGQESGTQIGEEHKLEAKDAYGLSKIKAEELVTKWCNKKNVVCTILRLPLLVGENPPGNLGAMINAIDKGYYFNIGGGKARKSMVLAVDVGNILIRASETGGLFNLTDGYHPSFFELSNAIAKQNRKSNPFNIPFFIAKTIALFGDIIGDKFPLNSSKLKKISTDLTFDDNKAREILGWNSRSVINWYR